jgi:hypothetical protein
MTENDDLEWTADSYSLMPGVQVGILW